MVAFFGVTLFALDAIFQNLSERAMRDLLDAQIVALIAAAEPQPDGNFEPAGRPVETRLETPGSGLYAEIQSTQPGDVPWRSPSTAGTFIDFGPPIAAGANRFGYSRSQQEEVAIASRGISFEDEAHVKRNLTFSVATSLTPYRSQLWSLRSQLFGGFFVLAIALLATLGVLLRWVLSPVRRLEKEITAVEEGTRETLGGGYPRELSGVTTNLNTLLIGERNRLQRYRDTLGNLAHGLKTPLAVMRATLPAVPGEPAQVLGHEIGRMTGIIEHQLKRAASGGTLLGQAPVDIEPMLAELRAALLKVYGLTKDMALLVEVEPGAQFVGDRGDLLELLGNLADNACKWCVAQVKITVAKAPDGEPQKRLLITVEDDGPGISTENRDRVLMRGVRADETVPGHGLGLSMVRDTVDLYRGSLAIDQSPLGGARFSLALPGR
jgi:two-component system sensor histidine kinase PhoQ